MNTDKNFEELMSLANNGNAEAQYNLGVYYDNHCEPENAVRWFSESAANDYPLAFIALSHAYAYGKGVKQDKKKAFEVLKQAADKFDEPELTCNLGIMYINGLGCKRDIKKGMELLGTITNGICQCSEIPKNIAFLYLKGNGVPVDYGKAAEYFEKAYNLGDKECAGYLSGIYSGKVSKSMKDKKKYDKWRKIQEEQMPSFEQFTGEDVEIKQEKSGRHYVVIDGEKCYVDEIVAKLFLPYPPTNEELTIEHIDGDWSNYSPNNLKWKKK